MKWRQRPIGQIMKLKMETPVFTSQTTPASPTSFSQSASRPPDNSKRPNPSFSHEFGPSNRQSDRKHEGKWGRYSFYPAEELSEIPSNYPIQQDHKTKSRKISIHAHNSSDPIIETVTPDRRRNMSMSKPPRTTTSPQYDFLASSPDSATPSPSYFPKSP